MPALAEGNESVPGQGWGKSLSRREIPAEVSWGDITNLQGSPGLAVASKQVARALELQEATRHRVIRDIWRNTGCRGVVLKRRLLDSKRDWQAQGEKSDRFQPEGTAQALTHSPLMINTTPPHHHTCQIHQEHHREKVVLPTDLNALRDSTKLSSCTGNPKTPLPFATHSPSRSLGL